MIPFIENFYDKNSYIVRSPYCIVYRYDKFYLNYKYSKNAILIDFIDQYAPILLELEIVKGAKDILMKNGDTEAIIIASVLDNYFNYTESELWDLITSYDNSFKFTTSDLTTDDDLMWFYERVSDFINETINFFGEYINYNELIYNYITNILLKNYDVPEHIERNHPDGDGRIFYPSILFIDDMIYIYFEYIAQGIKNEIINN